MDDLLAAHRTTGRDPVEVDLVVVPTQHGETTLIVVIELALTQDCPG
jgi:hypothetical protein